MKDPRLEVLALLRQAKKTDAEAFDNAIRDYIDNGDVALEERGKPGRPKTIARETYSMLLADIENAKEDGLSENQKLSMLAQQGTCYGRNEEGKARYWYSKDTIKTHLRHARHLYQTDQEFKELVDFHRWAFRTIS